ASGKRKDERRAAPPMKIGIVSPYAYPRPGGANAHIRETYERLRDVGHEVRIITAPWGDDPPARDVIQVGQAIAVPFNGSIGRVTLSLRLEWLVSRMRGRSRNSRTARRTSPSSGGSSRARARCTCSRRTPS